MKEIKITGNSDYKIFNDIYKFLLKNPDITFSEKLDSPDQSYYDFEFDNAKLCLHREHYLGIMIYSENDDNYDKIKKISSIIKENI
jgi:hypothetical protein